MHKKKEHYISGVMKLWTAKQDKKHFSATVCGFGIAVLFQEQQIPYNIKQ